jgi:4-azaleucine resistance transporter AzlC
MNMGVRFTPGGFLKGVRQTLPLAISVFVYVALFGMLARQAGLSLTESMLMSGIVFAGGSQLIALEMWHAPLPILAIIVTTLIVNLRHLLMGAALRPHLENLSPKRVYTLAFFMVDESWALTMREFHDGHKDAAFLLGSGFAILVTGQVSTAFGYLFGAVIRDPSLWGLDFAFLAVFTALLVGMWKGKANLFPWLVAALVSLAAAYILPGKWYILCGGLAGSLAGAWSHES